MHKINPRWHTNLANFSYNYCINCITIVRFDNLCNSDGVYLNQWNITQLQSRVRSLVVLSLEQLETTWNN